MSKMKEIFMDLQEEFGEKLEMMPIDFNYDDFIQKKLLESKNPGI